VLPPGGPIQTGPDQSTLVVGRRTQAASTSAPEPLAASDSRTEQAQLSLRPRLRAENILEAVPGLFTVQHAGGGKAQQYFLRGFDLDHGTDLAFFVDGLPVNAVSHAHGQGYSDFHFLIPETVATLDSTKGPYSARVGDFATAGSVTFHMADHVDESSAKAEVGSNGHQRVVVIESPDLGKDWRALAAAEVFHEDGPFVHPEDFSRVNAYTKMTHVLDDRAELSLLVMGYSGAWSMSGALPARAVCGEGDGTPVPAAYAGTRCLSRWDSLDPSQGGAAQRAMALAEYRRRLARGELEVSAYALRSNLQLFPNDGIAASFQPAGIQYGSQIEQDDARTEAGANLRVSERFDLAGTAVRATGGLQLRNDAIDVELHRTEQRQRLDGRPRIPGPIVDAAIDETTIGAYAEADWRPARWLRFVLGAREDRVQAAVTNQSNAAVDPVSGFKGQSQFSPKATAVVSPVRTWDLFATYGRGFHSNDARTLVAGTATTLMATATGYELGTTLRPLPGLSLSAVGFLLDLTSELTLDGDTASTIPSGPTRRYGGEFSARYELGNRIYFDATFTATHARYTDEVEIAAGRAYLPLAPIRTFGGGVGAREPVGPFTLIGAVYVRSLSDRPATQDGSLTATGFTLVNAEAGLRWRHLEVAADLLNVANTTWREGQFAVHSRLPAEGPNPPEGISFTPGIPRTLLVHAAAFW
jgi:outer membrane receptor protein involved in Fe transport